MSTPVHDNFLKNGWLPVVCLINSQDLKQETGAVVNALESVSIQRTASPGGVDCES